MSRPLGVCCAMTVLIGAAAPAAAQLRPGEQPIATLTVTAFSAAEYFRDGAAADPEFRGFLVSPSLQGFLQSAPVQKKRLTVDLTASSGFQYYERIGRVLAGNQSLGASVGTRLGRGTTVAVSPTVTYSERYSVSALFASLTPGAVDAPSPSAVDYAVATTPQLTVGARTTVSHTFGPRVSVTAGYDAETTEFIDRSLPGLTTASARGRVTYQLWRDLGVQAGYGRRLGRYAVEGGPATSVIDDIDIGLNFSRSLSLVLARNTSLSFSTGSSITGQGGRRNVGLTGTANLRHAIGRAANATLSYDRGVRLLNGFSAPVFVDTVAGRFGWSIGRGATVSLDSGLVLADEQLPTGGSRAIQAWRGSAQFSLSIARVAGVLVDYSYSDQRLGGGAGVADAVRSGGRHSVRIGLGTSLPLGRRVVRRS